MEISGKNVTVTDFKTWPTLWCLLITIKSAPIMSGLKELQEPYLSEVTKMEFSEQIAEFSLEKIQTPGQSRYLKQGPCTTRCPLCGKKYF